MSQIRFDDQVVIITGAGRGLGREYAKFLSARGAIVVVNDLGGALTGGGASVAPAEEVVRVIQNAGGRAMADHASVADEASMRALVARVVNSYGRIDVVINNAGNRLLSRFSEARVDDLRLQMDVGFFGAVHLTQAAWPHLRATRGRIVNTTSASFFGLKDYTGYVAAKGAVLAWTRTLAMECAESGIRVNAIAPAAVTRFMRGGGAATSILSWAEENLDPALVAPVVAYLAHADCALNGVVLAAGGSQVCAWLMGETESIMQPGLQPEHVRDRLADIMDENTFRAYASTADQARRFRAAFDEGAG